MPNPTDADLRAIDIAMPDEPDLSDLDQELTRLLDARRSALPSKGKKRDRPMGLQRLDTLYKNPENWQPWSNVTLVHQTAGGVDTILGFFTSFKHRTVLGARKLIRGPADPLLGHETEFVTDPWYVTEARGYHSEPSSELHFPVSLRLVLDDGLASEGEHTLHVGATRGVGIRRAVLDTAVRLSAGGTILYLPAGLDILDGLDHGCKVRLKEAFDLAQTA